MKGKMSIIKNYKFLNLDEGSLQKEYGEAPARFDRGIDEKIIKNERIFAEKNDFDIHPILRERRGVKAQESAAKEQSIENEIQKRLEEVRGAAFEKGYQEGRVKGENDVYEQAKQEVMESLDRLSEVIDEVLKSKIKLIREEKKQMYELIQTLAKWVILRELSDDGNYLKRLLDHLSQEIESGSEVVVYVDTESFNKMPEFIDYAKEKFKDFKNVKVEIGHDIEGAGNCFVL